jgi:ParB family transcriptional regulator, chromosome partitioning protein
MQLEFHQLDRRWEHLRVRHPARQRRLLASLAESGQQTPIVVVAAEDQTDRYVVIDGYKRLAALEQLGRDTVKAVVWPMSEAAAVLLDRSLRLAEHETALELGWLLSEMEQRFGYSLEELARQFDRSVTWVSRRLALVELLPEAIQQQVREGKIVAQVAMKFLVPVARQTVEDCQRMATIFAEHHCDTREAGQLYAAWRQGSAAIRKRILDDPALFFKAQRQEKIPVGPAAELIHDLEMVTAIVHRAHRRLAGADTVELDHQQRAAARQHIERIEKQLQRIAERLYRKKDRMLSQAQRTTILELHTQGVAKREIARVMGISRVARPGGPARKSAGPFRPAFGYPSARPRILPHYGRDAAAFRPGYRAHHRGAGQRSARPSCNAKSSLVRSRQRRAGAGVADRLAGG